MGWQDVVFGGVSALNAMAAANNYAQLQQLKQAGANASALQGLVLVMRNMIFSIKQRTDQLLELSKSSPKEAAAAMRILEAEVDSIGLKPEFFPEIADKEYAANTLRTLRENSQKLYGKLPKTDQLEVDQIIAATHRLSDCQFYLENYENANRYDLAHITVEKYGPRNSCSIKLLQIGMLVVFGIAVYILAAQLAKTISNPIQLVLWTSIAMIIFGIGLLAGFANYSRPNQYEKAKREMEKVKQLYDVERFESLDQEFKNSADAERVQQQLQQQLDQFFPNLLMATKDGRSLTY